MLSVPVFRHPHITYFSDSIHADTRHTTRKSSKTLRNQSPDNALVDACIEERFERLKHAWKCLPVITDTEGKARFWEGCQFEMVNIFN